MRRKFYLNQANDLQTMRMHSARSRCAFSNRCDAQGLYCLVVESCMGPPGGIPHDLRACGQRVLLFAPAFGVAAAGGVNPGIDY